MYKDTLINVITARPAKSAWSRGVKQTAIDMISLVDDVSTAKDVLNGARSPEDWVMSGYGLIYDEDIAKLLCTPSELRRTNGGKKQPNRNESWLGVYARAAWHAYQIICGVLKESPFETFVEMEKKKK